MIKKTLKDYNGSKYCPVCKQVLPVDKFGFRAGKRLLTSECKACRSSNRDLFKEMVVNCRGRAKKRGMDFDLDVDFIKELNKKQGGRCVYTKLKLNWVPGKGKGQRWCPPDRASMDRIDSTKGYTKDNVQLVTDFANRFKTYMSHDEIVEFAKRIVASLET